MNDAVRDRIFDFFFDRYDLALTESEIDDIRTVVGAAEAEE